jgi:hypothetical protein
MKDNYIRVHEYKISRALMHFFLSYFVSISFIDEFQKILLAKAAFEYLMNSNWNIKNYGQRSIRVARDFFELPNPMTKKLFRKNQDQK